MTPRTQSAFAVSVLVLAGALSAASPAHAAGLLYVDINDSTCSDAGPGTTADPYCHIAAAVKVALPGDTVSVSSGKYREQVTFPRSGTPAAPITVRAATSGVSVLGSLDVSDPAGWTATGGTAWTRPYSRTARQVLVDNQRLVAAVDLASLTAGGFWYDKTAKVLHIDLGGPNPGDGRVVEAGAESYGFNTTGRSDIVLDGLSTLNQNYFGVLASGGSGVRMSGLSVAYTGSYGIRIDTSVGSQLTDSAVRRADSHGILVKDSSAVLVARNGSDHNLMHGIALQGVTDSTVSGNLSWSNAKPGVRVSNGLDVNVASSRNVISGNTFWANQDSGMQFYNGSNDNLAVRNVSYRNGDHGFDTYKSTGNRYVSNTSFDNKLDGISIEGGSTGTGTWNNICADNGGYELYLDTSSYAGWTGGSDLLWRSATTTPIKVNGVRYANTAALRAGTGQESLGLWANPAFADPLIPDLHPSAASPAVDSADARAPGFTAIDHDGALAYDVAQVVDTGLGSPTYADRGALEYRP